MDSLNMNQVVDVFPWNNNFETGIAEIDTQHKKIVQLINQLSTMLADSTDAQLEEIFNELANYANFHFQSEEAIWANYFPKDTWYSNHLEKHQTFIPTILELKENKKHLSTPALTEEVVKFLIQWLAYHILDDDMQLALLVHKVEDGTPLEQAKKDVREMMSNSQDVFIQTVLMMYENLSTRTFDLMRERSARIKAADELQSAHDHLEGAVSRRTKELAEKVAELEKTEHELNKLIQAIEQSPVSVVVNNLDGHIHYSNPHFEKRNASAQQLDATNFLPFINKEKHEEIRKSLDKGENWNGEVSHLTPEGDTIWEHASISPVKDINGKVTQYLTLLEDITLQKAHEEKLFREANFHPLTHLPNLSNILGKVETMVTQEDRFALVCVDLFDINQVNKSLGYDFGDQIIKQSAKRLETLQTQDRVLAHLSGDLFLFIITNTANLAIEMLISQVNKAFAPAIIIEGETIYQRCNIGISLFPANGTNARELVNQARQAADNAKNKGETRYSYYTEKFKDSAKINLQLESELSEALLRDQIELHFQPKVDAVTGKFCGAEALVRWMNPKRGMVSPLDFIPIAEKKGHIVPIGDWILKKACEEARYLLDQGYDNFTIAVNVSPVQFANGGFIETLEQSLNLHDLDGKYIEVEITEGLLMNLSSYIDAEVAALRALDVRLALDDFGTGYSSLSYIRNFSFDTLKIDRVFIQNLEKSNEDVELIKAIIAMGTVFNKEVVAEGIETQKQADLLINLGCHVFQGYLYAKPMIRSDFEKWLAQNLS